MSRVRSNCFRGHPRPAFLRRTFRAALLLVALAAGSVAAAAERAMFDTAHPEEACACPAAAATHLGDNGIQEGMTYASWQSGEYRLASSDESLANLASTGANWIALLVTAYQRNISSTEIFYRNELSIPGQQTPTDADLIHVMRLAKTLNLKVMLKPHIDLAFDPTHWRGQIGGTFTENDWLAWFASYRNFINHYAQLSQANGVDQLCVGTELVTSSTRANDWRQVIADVRALYSGPMTYSSLWDSEDNRITWWDALDYVGVNAYYSLTNEFDPTLEDLKAGWVGPVGRLANLSARWSKPILITEIGYRSVDGACRHPWVWGTEGAPDRPEQALAYEAAFQSLFGEPWFAGIYWWHWSPNPASGSRYNDTYFVPQNKPAEAVLRFWYGGPLAPMLAVESTPVSCVPIAGAYPGLTHYSRTLAANTSVSLTAPARKWTGGRAYGFVRWMLDRVPQRPTRTELSFRMTGDRTAVAVYKSVRHLKIYGPTTVREHSRARYRSYAYFSDGSRLDVTPLAGWSDNSSRARFEAPGLLVIGEVHSDVTRRISAYYGGKRVYLYITIRNTD